MAIFPARSGMESTLHSALGGKRLVQIEDAMRGGQVNTNFEWLMVCAENTGDVRMCSVSFWRGNLKQNFGRDCHNFGHTCCRNQMNRNTGHGMTFQHGRQIRTISVGNLCFAARTRRYHKWTQAAAIYKTWADQARHDAISIRLPQRRNECSMLEIL